MSIKGAADRLILILTTLAVRLVDADDVNADGSMSLVAP